MRMLRILALLSCFTIVLCWTESSITQSNTLNPPFYQPRRLDVATGLAITSTNDVGNVKVLGICGGIGSGKSAACKLLVSELNCLAHIDSDSMAHMVYEPNSDAANEIVLEFGSDLQLVSGEIDRKKLGSIVFSDRNAMKKLECIVWPHVKTKIIQHIEAIKSELYLSKGNEARPIIVLEAAVLLDAEWNDILDGIWVITVSPSNALRRLQDNRSLTIEEAKKRIQAQSSRRGIGNLQNEVDAGTVSAVIPNESTLEDLKACLLMKLNDPSAWYQEK